MASTLKLSVDLLCFSAILLLHLPESETSHSRRSYNRNPLLSLFDNDRAHSREFKTLDSVESRQRHMSHDRHRHDQSNERYRNRNYDNRNLNEKHVHTHNDKHHQNRDSLYDKLEPYVSHSNILLLKELFGDDNHQHDYKNRHDLNRNDYNRREKGHYDNRNDEHNNRHSRYSDFGHRQQNRNRQMYNQLSSLSRVDKPVLRTGDYDRDHNLDDTVRRQDDRDQRQDDRTFRQDYRNQRLDDKYEHRGDRNQRLYDRNVRLDDRNQRLYDRYNRHDDRSQRLDYRNIRLEVRNPRLDDRYNREDERNQRLDDRYNRLDDRNQRLDDRYNRLDDRNQRLDDRYNRLDSRNQRLDDRYNRLDSRNQRLDDRYNRLDGRNQRLDDRYNRQDDRFQRLDDRNQRVDYRLNRLSDRNQRLDNRNPRLDDRYNRQDNRNSRLDDRNQRVDDRYNRQDNIRLDSDRYQKQDDRFQKHEYTFQDKKDLDNTQSNKQRNHQDLTDNLNNQLLLQHRGKFDYGGLLSQKRRPTYLDRKKSYNNLRARLEEQDDEYRDDDRKDQDIRSGGYDEQKYQARLRSLKYKLNKNLQDIERSPVKSLLRAADNLDCAAQLQCIKRCGSNSSKPQQDECHNTCQEEIPCQNDDYEDLCNESGHDSCGGVGTGSTKGELLEENNNCC